MGGGKGVSNAGELREGGREYQFQLAGVSVGGVNEPATEEENVVRAGGEDFE